MSDFDGLDNRDKVGSAEENGIYGHVLLGGLRQTEHGPIWLICGHPGSWSRRRWSQSLDQCQCRDHLQSMKVGRYMGAAKKEQERDSSGATPQPDFGLCKLCGVVIVLFFFAFFFLLFPRVDTLRRQENQGD